MPVIGVTLCILYMYVHQNIQGDNFCDLSAINIIWGKLSWFVGFSSVHLVDMWHITFNMSVFNDG